MTKESLERVLNSSMALMLCLAALDLLLFMWVETAVVTVIAHGISLWIFLRYRLAFDLVKLLENSGFIVDVYLIYFYGYALASPIITLFTIIHISLNKNYHLNRLKRDMDKIMNLKKKDIDKYKNDKH